MDTLQPFRDLQLSDPEGFAVAAIVVTRILQHDDEVANIRGESDAPRVDTGAMVFSPVPSGLPASHPRTKFLRRLVSVVESDLAKAEEKYQRKGRAITMPPQTHSVPVRQRRLVNKY